MSDTPKLLTSREVADMFRVDVSSVRRWVSDGTLKVSSRTPGGQMRFSEDDISNMRTNIEQPSEQDTK